MAVSRPNPVLAPLRRWVLYSRTNLAITIGGLLAVGWLLGQVFGQPLTPASSSAGTTSTPEKTSDSAVEGDVTFDLVEVTESLVSSKTVAWTRTSAPAVAMAYARNFVDTTSADQQWLDRLGQFTVSDPGDALLDARPPKPVVITGPTSSTQSEDGRRVTVRVPTQAGEMRLTAVLTEIGGHEQWRVNTPFPTLDLEKVVELPTVATTTSRSAGANTTSTSQYENGMPVYTPPRVTVPPLADSNDDERSSSGTDDSGSSSTPSAPLSADDEDDEAESGSAQLSDPTPVPGPIPIPDLDTPIPGER